MPVYLAPVIGTGSEDDPIRAPYLGDDPRIGWMHLGPPGTNLGSALLYLPAAVGDVGFDKISDDDPREAMPMLTRSRASTRLGVVTSKTPFREWTAELLMDLGDARARWRGIRNGPSRERNRHEIWLGGLGCIWDQAVAPRPSTQSFPETWPGADGAITAGRDQTWAVIENTPEVVSNVFRSSTLAGATGRCESVLDTKDQYHLATFTCANVAGLSLVWVICRCGADINNVYRLNLQRNASVFSRSTAKRVAAAQTTFSIDASDPGASGTTQLTVDGTTITGRINGAIILGPATDPSEQLTPNVKGGARAAGLVTVGDATLDTHTIADVAAAGAPLAVFHRHYAAMRNG